MKTIQKSQTFNSPQLISSILEMDDFYIDIIEGVSTRSLDNLTEYKLNKFKNNYKAKILFFLDLFFDTNSRSNQLKTGQKLKTYKQEISATNLSKLFHRNYYKSVLNTLKKWGILSVQKGYSTYSNEYVENYESLELAQKRAIENGKDPKKAHGSCKKYYLTDLVSKSANGIDGMENVEVELTDAQLKTLNKYIGALEEDDHVMVGFGGAMSNDIEFEEDVTPELKLEDYDTKEDYEMDTKGRSEAYRRLSKGSEEDVSVRRGKGIDNRLHTDHCLVKRRDLHKLRTSDGRKLASLDGSAFMPSFTVHELVKENDSLPKQYDRLCEATSNGQLYELIGELVYRHQGKDYSRDDIKSGFRFVMYEDNREYLYGEARDIHDTLKLVFPLWLDKVQELNSEESFKHTFGVGGILQNKKNYKRKNKNRDPQNYIYYHYADFETEFMFEVMKEVIHTFGRLIPLATRYDGVLVAENDAGQVLDIMNEVSQRIHSIPLHFHEEQLTTEN